MMECPVSLSRAEVVTTTFIATQIQEIHCSVRILFSIKQILCLVGWQEPNMGFKLCFKNYKNSIGFS